MITTTELIKPNKHFENLVLEGGGVKGIAYVGALKALDAKGELKSIKRVGGSSAGGITALLIALGYTPEQIEQELKSVELTSFQDSRAKYWSRWPKWLDTNTGTMRHWFFQSETMLRALRKKKVGIYEGEIFLNWAKAKITEKLGTPNATFADLKRAMDIDPSLNFKELMLTATKVSTQGGDVLQYFDAENTGNVRIADALRATMSFPGAFETYDITINGTTAAYVDGGLCNNFPMEYYDNERCLPKGEKLNRMNINPYTLGLRVDTQEEINTFKHGQNAQLPKDGKPDPRYNIFGLLRSMLGALLSDRDKVHHKYYGNTVQIYDAGVSTLNFSLSEGEKANLMNNGKTAVDEWFEVYRGADVFLEKKKFKSIEEAYKNQSDEQIKKKYEGLESQLKNESLPDEERAAILREQKLIRLIRPELFNKTPKEQVLQDMNRLLDMEINYAQESLQSLETMSFELQRMCREAETVVNTQSAMIAYLRSIQQEPDQGLHGLLVESFDEVVRVKNTVDSELNEFDAKKRNNPELCESDAVFDAQMRIRFESMKKMVMVKLKMELMSKEGLTEDYREFIIQTLENQLEKAFNGTLEPIVTSDQTYLDACLLTLESNNQALNTKLIDLKEQQQKCSEQLQNHKKTLAVLHANRQRCGDDFNRMYKLSGDLKKFIDDQNGVYSVCRAARLSLKVILSPLYLSYLAIKKTASVVFKSDLERWKSFEHLFLSKRELYRKEAKTLRNNIQNGLKEWDAQYPKENMIRYVRMLEITEKNVQKIGKPKNKHSLQHEKASAKSILLGYVTPQLEKSRLIRENRETVENIMGATTERERAEHADKYIQIITEKRDACVKQLAERVSTKEIQEIVLPFNQKLEELEKVKALKVTKFGLKSKSTLL